MVKKIQRPQNWQDFESLCQMLWGEIWQCSEIQKNGRSGQSQNGVDIYGIPKNDTSYYGIQCKGKDDFVNNNLTRSEIDAEVAKAKLFKPELKKFYFATTAIKDVNLEEYIRIKNVEHIAKGIFEIHLFAWDDIATKIRENKDTYNRYLNDTHFESSYSVDLTFSDGKKEMECKPEFEKYHVHHHDFKLFKELGIEVDFPEIDLSDIAPLKQGYFKKQLIEFQKNGVQEDNEEQKTDPQPYEFDPFNKTYQVHNKSVSTFTLIMKNTGRAILENYKIYLTIEGVANASTVIKNTGYLDVTKYNYTVKFTSPNEAVFKPLERCLVQNDSATLDQICFKTSHKSCKVKIVWRLVASGFEDCGELLINVKPKLEKIYHTIYNKDAEDRAAKIIIKNKYDIEYR